MTQGLPLKEVGFFHTADELSAARTAVERDWETAVVRYLEQGGVIMASAGWVVDLLAENETKIGRHQVRTDGEWVWPSDLAYYVSKYHVELPAEFLDHMASSDWVVPRFDDEALEALGERYWEQSVPAEVD